MSDIQGVVLELFSRHHQSLESRIVDIVAEALKPIHHILQELKQMSQTLSSQLDAALASINTAVDGLSTEITAIAAEVTTLVAGMAPGSTLSQAQIDTANAIAARLTALDTSAQAIVAQGQPAPATPPTP
jgi:cob(I)alamin adenosyltransferase